MPVSSPPDLMIEAHSLVKRYGTKGRKPKPFTAVAGLDLAVRRGECFGLLGPNGAGKSTTMRMIACVSKPTEGTLAVLGLDTRTNGPEIRGRIGVVPQDDAFDMDLTVSENLRVYGRYFGLSRAQIDAAIVRLLEFARLEEKADERVDALSGGMRRRLTIARALINDPEMVLLDEPTAGLDPQARQVLWERLFQLKKSGVTLVLTTHYMDEAEQLCDRIVVVDGGLIVDEGSPRRLIDRHCTREVLELRYDTGDLADLAERVRKVLLGEGGAADGSRGERVEVLPDRLLCYTEDGEASLAALVRAALSPAGALVRRSTLEDVFLALTGRKLVD